MPNIPPRTPQISYIDMAANYETAYRLLQAVPFELSLDGDFKWVRRDLAERMFGLDLPQTLSQFSDRFEALTPRVSISALTALLPGAQGQWDGQMSRRDHHTRYYEIIISPMGNTMGNSLDQEEGFIGVVRDVSNERLEAQRLKSHAKRADELGSLNVSDFALQKNFLTLLSQTYCPNAACISFTLKNQERLDEIYGSAIKSHIEYEILRRLIAFLPPAALTAQQDETILCLLPDIEMIDPESLSQALTAFPVSTSEGPVLAALNIEIGLLSATDVKISAPPQSKPAPDMAKISEDNIIDLLNQRSLSLALQPVCAAASGDIHHYEALMRVDDPTRGPISAWRHILRAEDLGLVHLLDQRALERAALLLIRYPDVHLALNVSAGTIGDPKKQQDYLEQLDAYPALHARLSFEMTETMALAQSELAALFAQKLKSRGCYLSIDDFGAGHTSFETLMLTEARQIKLDGSLIEGLCRNSDKQNFVRLMVDFAHTFDVTLVAERVETLQEQKLLSALGVDYLQGYYLGRPVPEHDFTGVQAHS